MHSIMLVDEKTQLLPAELDVLDTFWTTIFPRSVVAQHARDIKKLGILLHFIGCTRFFLFALPLRWFLWLFCFEPEFAADILFPLVAFLIGLEDEVDLVTTLTCGTLHDIFVGANHGILTDDAEAVLFTPIAHHCMSVQEY